MEVKLEDDFPSYRAIFNRLVEPFADNLIDITGNLIKVTPKGKSFLRNICMAFDLRYWANQPKGQVFSMAV